MIIFAKYNFTLWIGADFAVEAALPFQLLALAMLVALFGPIASALLQGRGRPDIVSKVYMIHLPLNTVVVWFLVTRWGITGAALSATIRSFLDAALLFYFSARLSDLRVRKLINKKSLPAVGAVGFSVLLLEVGWISASQAITTKALLFAVTMTAYTFVSFRFVSTWRKGDHYGEFG